MTIRYSVVIIAIMLSTHQMVHAAEPQATTEELVAIVANPNIPADARIEAERLLIGRVEEHYLLREHRTMLGRKDPDALPLVFREFNQLVHTTPAGEAVMFPVIADSQIDFGVPGLLYPSSGDNPERDAERLPPHAQVYYALNRVWDYLIAHAEPEDRRKEIVIALYDEIESEYQLYKWMGATVWNGSELVEEKLWSIFADRERSSAIRIASASTLSQTTHLRSYTSFAHYSPRMIEYAWEERGSDLAAEMGGRLGGPRCQYPYLDALKLDWYVRERTPKPRQSNTLMKNTVDRIDVYFGNISGMYQTRDQRMARARLIGQQRNALREEARETGGDTKLREFEAEVAAQQQAELELRIERIDAWIAKNQDRLEQEAEEYHRKRMREQAEGG